MAIIKGRDIVATINGKDQYHAKSHQLSVDINFEEWQTKSTEGKEREFIDVTGTISVDGLVCTSESNNTEMDTAALLDTALEGKSIEVACVIGAATYKATKAWITNFSATGPDDSTGTYTAQIAFNGLTKQA